MCPPLIQEHLLPSPFSPTHRGDPGEPSLLAFCHSRPSLCTCHYPQGSDQWSPVFSGVGYPAHPPHCGHEEGITFISVACHRAHQCPVILRDAMPGVPASSSLFLMVYSHFGRHLCWVGSKLQQAKLAETLARRGGEQKLGEVGSPTRRYC